MKKFLIFFLMAVALALLAHKCSAQSQNVTATPGAGTLLNPANFWTANAVSMLNAEAAHASILGGTGITITGTWPNQTVTLSGGGSGTVTSFSSGNLSPLFTTSVATSTTTPALSFALTNAAQNAFLAGPTSGTGAPTYRAIVAADVPTLNQNTTGTAANVTGVVAVANGGTGLNTTGILPAFNGSALTNLNGSNVTTGTVADARLSANVTLQGNTFNGASQLIKNDASGVTFITQTASVVPVATTTQGAFDFYSTGGKPTNFMIGLCPSTGTNSGDYYNFDSEPILRFPRLGRGNDTGYLSFQDGPTANGNNRPGVIASNGGSGSDSYGGAIVLNGGSGSSAHAGSFNSLGGTGTNDIGGSFDLSSPTSVGTNPNTITVGGTSGAVITIPTTTGTMLLSTTATSGSSILYGNGSGGFSNVTVNSPLTFSGGALGTTALVSPMTTLGDIIYENATPAAARLAGSTSASLALLTQTGTGSVSAAPAWSTSPAFNGSNITSLNASNLSSGTVPAAQMPALTGDVTSSSGTVATTVGKINGTALSGLATGLLKNTTSTGVPSIATSGTDYSAGTSANATGLVYSTTSTGALTKATSAQVAAGLTGATGTLDISGNTVTLPSSVTVGGNTITMPASAGTLLLTNGSGSSLTGIPTSVSGTTNQIVVTPTTGACVASLASPLTTPGAVTITGTLTGNGAQTTTNASATPLTLVDSQAAGSSAGAFAGLFETGAAATTGDRFGGIYSGLYNNASPQTGGLLGFYCESTWTGGPPTTSRATYLQLQLVTSGTTSLAQVMRIASTGQLSMVNPLTPSSTAGGGIGLYEGGTANPNSGDRLGYFLFGLDNTASPINAALIGGFADATWTGISRPTNIQFQTVPVGSTSRATVATIGSQGNFTITGSLTQTSATGVGYLTSGTLGTATANNIAAGLTGNTTAMDLSGADLTLPSKYLAASGTNTYTATLSPAITAYKTGTVYTIQFTNANTSTATLNLNSLGAKAIQLAGAALSSGQIPANTTLNLVYDGTQFQICSLSGSAGSGTVTSVGLSTDASWMTVASSPVTTSGTITYNKTTGLTANQVLATPDGSTGTVGLRSLVGGDLPQGLTQCQLVYTNSTTLTLNRYSGSWIMINGVNYQIPGTAPTLANTGLTAATLYYIYVYMNSGTMTLEASATGHSTNTTTGIEQKTGDATRSFVGWAYMGAGTPGTFVDTQANRTVASFYNRRPRDVEGTVLAGTTTTSGSFVEISSTARVGYIATGNDSFNLNIAGYFTLGSTNQGIYAALGLDGTTQIGNHVVEFDESLTSGQSNCAINVTATESEGYHYVTLIGKTTGSASGAYYCGVGGTVQE